MNLGSQAVGKPLTNKFCNQKNLTEGRAVVLDLLVPPSPFPAFQVLEKRVYQKSKWVLCPCDHMRTCPEVNAHILG
jgi:hypothetical protein